MVLGRGGKERKGRGIEARIPVRRVAHTSKLLSLSIKKKERRS